MSKLKKILDIASIVALVLLILFAALLVGVRIFGIEPHIVLSGSMEPEIYTGALAYVHKLSPEEACQLKAGDTVTYVIDSRGTKVTHKIYEVVGVTYIKDQYGEPVLNENGEPQVAVDSRGYTVVMYTTYGINNKNPQDPTGYTLDGKLGVGNLASSNVFGKPIFSIPLLGYIAHFVQNPPGKYVSIMICIALVGFSLLPDIFSKIDGKFKAEDAHQAAESAAPP